MAQYNSETLNNLFLDTATKAKLTLEHSDSDILAEEINSYGDNPRIKLTGSFIYEAQRKIKVALENKEESITFNSGHINRLAQFLGLRDFSQYKTKDKKKPDEDGQETKKQKSQNHHNQTTIMGKNINKFEGDADNITVNNN